MARVTVERAELEHGEVRRLAVRLGATITRTLPREAVIQLMRDQHSFIAAGVALQLVGVDEGDDTRWFIRTDNAAEASDLLPRLPAL